MDRAPPARRDRGLCPSEASRKFYDFFCGLSEEAIFPNALGSLGIVVLFQSRPVQPFCQILACRSSCAPSSSCPSTPSKGRSNKAGLNLRRLFPLYMCVCARAWATWLLSGPAAAASAPEIDPNNPDHFDMELEACLDAVAAHPGAMSAALHQQDSIYYPCRCFCQAFGL